MKKTLITILGLSLSFSLGYFLNLKSQPQTPLEDQFHQELEPLNLGAFSVSLNVKDLAVSKEFYEKLGFQAFAGSMDQNYLIMKNEAILIGLFQGMFEGNILTFNPGWDQDGKDVDDFEDVRAIQQKLRQSGLSFILETDEDAEGPAAFMLADPDGNMILVDQHR